jgi:lipid-binding SYLF domain-containing protein
MRRAILATAFLGLLGGCAGGAGSQAQQQALVDRATLTVQEMLSDNTAPARDAANRLRAARAIVICPQLFRAGFIFGGEGGACVLVGRDGAGSWSSPAFFGIGSGSVGLQAGLQDSQVMIMVMNDRALNALLSSQFTLGADASLAVATIGGGIGAGTTTAVGPDLVTYTRARGLFAGVTLEGSVLSSREEQNRAYYGQAASARQITVDMAAHNPGADPLRSVLMRFGTRQ